MTGDYTGKIAGALNLIKKFGTRVYVHRAGARYDLWIVKDETQFSERDDTIAMDDERWIGAAGGLPIRLDPDIDMIEFPPVNAKGQKVAGESRWYRMTPQGANPVEPTGVPIIYFMRVQPTQAPGP